MLQQEDSHLLAYHCSLFTRGESFPSHHAISLASSCLLSTLVFILASWIYKVLPQLSDRHIHISTENFNPLPLDLSLPKQYRIS